MWVVKRLLAPLMAALLLTIVATPAVSGAGTSARWTAWLATNGTATLSVGTSGSGTLVLRLTGLTPRASYPVALERGTCAMPGTKRISLPAVKASSAGAVTRTFRLTAAQATSARASTKSGLLVRAGSLCGLFIVPLPQLALRPGDAYFSIGGRQQIVFARNLTSYWQTDFNTILGLTKAGGGRMVRIQLDSLGDGMSSVGVVDETWARKWEQVIDRAAADGIYVIPVFSGWFDWNDGPGYSTWKANPLNKANGGPAPTPAELFTPGSTTQAMWLSWVKALVRRWQTRTNIAAWEVFSEVNLASGVSEQTGVSFVERAASVIRGADPRARPVTASLADLNEWPTLLRSPAVDFIEIHPYPASGRLDTTIIADVRRKLADYGKPVFIGESGLSADPPDGTTLSTAGRARVGIEHAIWAGLVSGAMDGRALYWEDSFAIYFPDLGMPFVRNYANAELAASKFASTVDVAGFRPLAARVSADIIGAAVGNEREAIGWFRDAGCEPPDWPLRQVVSNQSVTITPAGSAPRWRVDFYSTTTGTDLIGSVAATRQGDSITFPLPAFTDAIAFKMYAQP